MKKKNPKKEKMIMVPLEDVNLAYWAKTYARPFISGLVKYLSNAPVRTDRASLTLVIQAMPVDKK